jgi:hypothetical protein
VVKSVGFVSLTILLASLGTRCSAKKEHAPLPSQVLAAKTVYVENHGSASVKDATYGDLKKWGRREIIEDRIKADLVIVLRRRRGAV